DENNESDRSGIRKGTMFPSSLGISFVVAKRVTQVSVATSWGQYQRTDSASLQTSSGNPKKVWKRTPYGGEPLTVTLREGPIAKVSPEPRKPDVHVEGIVRT